MQKSDAPLAEFLVDAGVLSRGQLTSIRAEGQDGSLTQILLEKGSVGEDELHRAQARFLGIPFIRLEERNLDATTLALLPESLCRTHELVAVSRHGDEVEIALLDIGNFAVLESLHLPYRLRPRLTDRASLNRALLSYQKNLKESFTPDLDGLFAHALGQGTNTLHLEPQDSGLRVRYRTGGVLRDAMVLPESIGRAIVARLKQHARLFSEALDPQEGRFTLLRPTSGGEEKILVRVSTLPTKEGERIVISLMPLGRGHTGFTLEGVGLHGVGLEDMYQALSHESGLVLVVGPAGSGKTTFLYVLLSALDNVSRHIVTVEQQITSHLPFASQVATDQGTLSPASALRSALRQDADVLMIDEIRDGEVATLAVSAAARGVLILAGVEAATTSSGIEKFISLGVDSEILGEVLSCAVGVRIARRLCLHSRTPQRMSRAQLNALEKSADVVRVMAALKEERQLDVGTQWKDIIFYEPQSCSQCQDGYVGLLGVQEVLLSRGRNGLSLPEDVLYKAALGLTDAGQALEIVAEQ